VSQTDVEHIKHAKKKRRCDWCFEFIQPGEPYARWRWFGESSPMSVGVHEVMEGWPQVPLVSKPSPFA